MGQTYGRSTRQLPLQGISRKYWVPNTTFDGSQQFCRGCGQRQCNAHKTVSHQLSTLQRMGTLLSYSKQCGTIIKTQTNRYKYSQKLSGPHTTQLKENC